ncbi:MAG: hypothetical protein EPN82_03895 [Bacteroidetes bacterium]|nr:MAG: hypothetical protein EPN82_03895 [Bacteroidota bacterium]
MNLLLKIYITLFSAIFLYSADNPYELAKINVDLNEIGKNNKTKTVEFLSATKKSYGKYICVDINDIIAGSIKHLNEQEKCRLLIVAESSDSEAITSTYFDYDPNNTKLAPVLILKTVQGSVGDTIKVSDVKGKKGVVDLSMVEKELQKSIVERIYLQIKTISQGEKFRIFNSGSIVFPQDQTINRWIGKISNIKIYIIK